jgi:hypothetical protein
MLLGVTITIDWYWPVAGPLLIVTGVWFLRQFRMHIQRRKKAREAEAAKPPVMPEPVPPPAADPPKA